MEMNTYELHSEYTRNEFSDSVNSEYYGKVLKFLSDKRIKTVLDIGGCTGETAAIFLEIPSVTHVTVVEPIVENAAFIRGRFYKNTRVTVVERALYYGPSTLELNIAPASVGGATPYESRDTKRTVSTIDLESLPEADFIKIDCEGCEENIIRNSGVLRKIPYIEVEFHHYNQALGDRELWMKTYLPHKPLYDMAKGRFFMAL